MDDADGVEHPGGVPDSSDRLPDLIEGPRVVLRRWQPADATALSEAVERNIEHLRPWMPWVEDEPLDPAARLRLVDGWERAWSEGGDVVLGAFVDGRVIGSCGLHRRCGPGGLEIGYWVDKDHLRRGIGTEIARLLTTAALGVDGVTFVEIHHDKANVASGGIPARLGYAFVGEGPDGVNAPGAVGVECIWRMEASSWRPAGSPSG